jgi:predicted DNA-binding antitoxin AbrB/MazE fold protein
MSENKNKFNDSFKRLVLKEGNKFLIELEINLNKLKNSIKNLVIQLKEFSHY